MSLAYDVVVGTGGIGSGIFLALEGNRTLGREESRPAQLLDQRDYCKLHIVCHYVRRLLGPRVPVVAVGRVGDDDAGRRVRAEMDATGLDTQLVCTSAQPTLFSVCFQYPDGDGGNLSTSRSASAAVTVDDVEAARAVFARHRGRGIALALPEVPLQPRLALLRLATEHAWLRVAAIVPDEVETARDAGLLGQVDLLALNLAEAAALAGASADAPPPDLVAAAVAALAEAGSGADLVVTAGARGSWSWDGRELVHAGVVAVQGPVASTAGAGDAHLSGLVVGLAVGLDLAAANAFASLVSSATVRSPHTIDPDLGPAAVLRLASRLGRTLPPALVDVLDGAST